MNSCKLVINKENPSLCGDSKGEDNWEHGIGMYWVEPIPIY